MCIDDEHMTSTHNVWLRVRIFLSLLSVRSRCPSLLLHSFRQCTGYLTAYPGIIMNESDIFGNIRLRDLNVMMIQTFSYTSIKQVIKTTIMSDYYNFLNIFLH